MMSFTKTVTHPAGRNPPVADGQLPRHTSELDCRCGRDWMSTIRIQTGISLKVVRRMLERAPAAALLILFAAPLLSSAQSVQAALPDLSLVIRAFASDGHDKVDEAARQWGALNALQSDFQRRRMSRRSPEEKATVNRYIEAMAQIAKRAHANDGPSCKDSRCPGWRFGMLVQRQYSTDTDFSRAVVARFRPTETNAQAPAGPAPQPQAARPTNSGPPPQPVAAVSQTLVGAGVITTVAGGGGMCRGHWREDPIEGVKAVDMKLCGPEGVAVDRAGNVYIANTTGNNVLKVDTTGQMHLVAGSGAAAADGDGGPAPRASLTLPRDLTLDGSGNLYVSAAGRILKVGLNGVISTAVGWSGRRQPPLDYTGDGGPATEAKLLQPWGVAVDTAGNLYLADNNGNRVRKVTPSGIITTVAGGGQRARGFEGDGGAAASAQVHSPMGLAVDSAGNLYIGDQGNNRVRKIATDGTISTVAGSAQQGFSGDGGPATLAQLNNPQGVAVDARGNLFIADHVNRRVRMVTPSGIIATVAGNGQSGSSGDGGPATDARLSPNDVAVDAAGNLYIADASNHSVRRVTQAELGAQQALQRTRAQAEQGQRIQQEAAQAQRVREQAEQAQVDRQRADRAAIRNKFAAAYGATFVDFLQLQQNPFVFQGKVVAVSGARFRRMVSATSAEFFVQYLLGIPPPVTLSAVPSTKFGDGRLLGDVLFLAFKVTPRGDQVEFVYLGSEPCPASGCGE